MYVIHTIPTNENTPQRHNPTSLPDSLPEVRPADGFISARSTCSTELRLGVAEMVVLSDGDMDLGNMQSQGESMHIMIANKRKPAHQAPTHLQDSIEHISTELERAHLQR